LVCLRANNPPAVLAVYQWRIGGITLCDGHVTGTMASFVTSGYLQACFGWQCAHTVWMWCQYTAQCW